VRTEVPVLALPMCQLHSQLPTDALSLHASSPFLAEGHEVLTDSPAARLKSSEFGMHDRFHERSASTTAPKPLEPMLARLQSRISREVVGGRAPQ
jgi:hypothetical protein